MIIYQINLIHANLYLGNIFLNQYLCKSIKYLLIYLVCISAAKEYSNSHLRYKAGLFIICISTMQTDSKDCVHKIIYFQSHRSCNQIASICKQQCQSQHASKQPHAKYSRQIVLNQFNLTRSIIIGEVQKFSVALRKFFEDMINKVKKREQQYLQQMQQELVKTLVQNMKIDRLLFDKIENDRLQKIKCIQIHRLLDRDNVQKKIDRTKLQAVYEKYQSIASNFFQAFDLKKQSNLETTQTANIVQGTLNEENQFSFHELKDRHKLLHDENEYLRIQIEEIKLRCNQFEVQKADLERKIIKKRIEDLSKRRIKTWNIAIVDTKKCKKSKLIALARANQKSQKMNDKNQKLKGVEDQGKTKFIPSHRIPPPYVANEVIFEQIQFFPMNSAPKLNQISQIQNKNKDYTDSSIELKSFIDSKNKI